MAELFLMNGDMCAWLYTGSPAMHSEKITMFEPETSRLKKAGAGTYGNPFITIRRRYNNVLMDEERKNQTEIFLGLKNRQYFPTLHLEYREPEGVPLDQDWPESDDEGPATASGSSWGSAGCKDPLGALTWPVESKGRSAVGTTAGNGSSGLMLSGMGASAAGPGSSEGTSAAQWGVGAAGSNCLPEQFVDRHKRSFSSEKILQDFQALHTRELSDSAPPASNVLKPFEDPLGLL
eukprot:gene4193-4441_t